MMLNYVFLLITVIGGCSTCSDHCLKCITLTFCTECETGYSLKDRRCHGCSHPCMSYKSTNSCESCYSGYYLLHECCYPCISPCHECAIVSCTSCISGYGIYNGMCNPCSSGCLNCSSELSGPLSCTLCKSEYYLNDSICNKCSDGCLECTSPYCSFCKSGYYLSNGNCYKCSSPCLECTSLSNCSSCVSGYNLSNGHCVKCNISCLTCLNTTGDCTSCHPKFYLKNKSCIPCETNCPSCNSSSGICDVCEDGYYGDYCNNTCRKRCNGSACDQISGKCIDGCKVGYHKKGNTCVMCPKHCKICKNSITCNNCNDEYYLKTLEDGSFRCVPCDDKCSSCLQSQCIASDVSVDSKGTIEIASSGIIAGVAVGTLLIGIVLGIVSTQAFKRHNQQREAANQQKDRVKETADVSAPSVFYVNTSSLANLDNLNELPVAPATYESLSRRDGESNLYSTLT